jgi:integrase
MATIEWRSDTSYRVTVSCGYDSNGKQIRKKKTFVLPDGLSGPQIKKETQRQSVLFEQEVQSGTYLDGGKITFGEFALKWLSDYAEIELAPKTVQRYKLLLDRINQAMGHLQLSKIQPLHITRFMANLSEGGIRNDSKYKLKDKYSPCLKENREAISESGVNPATITRILKGSVTTKETADKISTAINKDLLLLFEPQNTEKKLSPQTVRHHYRLLSTVLNSAVQWNLLLSNPANRVNPPRVEHKEIESLDDVEVSKMLALLESEPLKYQAAVHIAVFGGLRLGEINALKWTDIDFDSGKLSITKAGQYVSGIGSIEKSPKNKSSIRALKLPEVALAKLKALRQEQLLDRLAMGTQWVESGNIFIQWNGSPIFYSTIGHWFTKWISKTTLSQITFHGLRHTNTSLLIAHGTNIATVSKRLGHSRISTTSDIYTHALHKMDEEAANTLDNLFTKKNQNILTG